MKRSVRFALPALIMLCVLYGCTGTKQGSTGETAAMTILTAHELAQVREAMTNGERQVTWGEPTAAGLWPGPAEERGAARDAIRAEAARLAAVDFPSLALPDFLTQTRGLALKTADFTGADAQMEAYEVGSNNGRGAWAIYSWAGPRFPDHLQRPLVHRWVEVYTLYDTGQKRVLRLLATIRGEALE